MRRFLAAWLLSRFEHNGSKLFLNCFLDVVGRRVKAPDVSDPLEFHMQTGLISNLRNQ